MNTRKLMIVALVGCCLSVLPIYGEERPQQQDFRRLSPPQSLQQQELSELKTLVAELRQRIESLETQLAQSESPIRFRSVEIFKPETDRAQDKHPESTVVIGGFEKGMMIDAIEHAQRFSR